MQISVLAGVLSGLRRTRRGIGGAGGVPLSRVGQTQAVVIGEGIVHADNVGTHGSRGNEIDGKARDQADVIEIVKNQTSITLYLKKQVEGNNRYDTV